MILKNKHWHSLIAIALAVTAGLAQAAPGREDIVIGQVVRHTEGIDMPAECFGEGHGRCRIERICHLRGVLQQAVEAFYAVLDNYTLADLAHNRTALSRVLFMQPAAGHG